MTWTSHFFGFEIFLRCSVLTDAGHSRSFGANGGRWEDRHAVSKFDDRNVCHTDSMDLQFRRHRRCSCIV